MPSLLDQYLPLAVFMAVAAVISGALLVAPFLVAFKAPDPEKLSAYDCGRRRLFSPQHSSRARRSRPAYIRLIASLS
jgi:NADH:ubiquinone oxidoreductase subunit 3 (subunit A)